VFVCLTASVLVEDASGTGVELHALDAARSSEHAPVTIEGDGAAAVIQLQRSPLRATRPAA
jgi:hypothetical protein